jgi:hypothetical protein
VNGDEQQDLRRLLGLLERTKPWEDLTGNPSDAWQAQAGSALAGDDAKTDPYQVSHAAWHALTVAVDHLHCLRNSLVADSDGDDLSMRIHTQPTTHGQSSLVRGAIENGARAVWLLGPTTRLIRVKRRLALGAMEMRHCTGSASWQGHRRDAPRISGRSNCGILLSRPAYSTRR